MGKSKRKSEGQYVPLPYSQLKSPACRSLSGPAIKVWLELHTHYHGGNNGQLTLSYAEAAETLGMGKASVQRAYNELVDHGFLALEKEGNWYRRLAHEWRLTTKPMQRPRGKELATHDWREKTKRGSKSEPSARSVVPFQNRKRVHGSVSEPVSANSDQSFGSKSEH